MAKATKSRKPGKGGRKPAAKAKPRKPAKAAAKKKASKSASAKKGASAKRSAPKARAKASPRVGLKRSAGAATKIARPAVVDAALSAAALLPRPDRPALRSAGPKTSPVAEQAAEGDTPPALPVPIASFTF
jgi:hypothetical protein